MKEKTSNIVNNAKKAKKAFSKAVFSKTFMSAMIFAVALAITVVYSLLGVSWDVSRIDWGKFTWNMSIIIGLFLLTMFSGWMLEQQNVLSDDMSELSKARKDYQNSRDKIRPKDQYFGQYYLWEKTRQLNAIKADALTAIGWRNADGGDCEGKVLNATAQDIANYATERDIDKAMAVSENDAVLVDHGTKRFYISRISEEMGKETKKILTRDEKIDFCSAEYYLIGSSYDTKSNSPRFAKGKEESKRNTSKAVTSVMFSAITMVAWSVLVAGAAIDQFYGSSIDAYFNLLSRVISLFCGLTRGMGIADNYYNGLAILLRDKIEVLEGFYNCVMVDGNFKPDTLTTTAEGLFLKAREEERKKAEEARKAKEAEKKEEPTIAPVEPLKETKKEEKSKIIEEKVSINDLL